MTDLPTDPPAPVAAPAGAAKRAYLLAFYQSAAAEANWRRTAGYRTIILGLGFSTFLIAASAGVAMPRNVRVCLATVVFFATVFGSGYLVSNFYDYRAAARRMLRIERYAGAYDADFLGALGPLTRAGTGVAEKPLYLEPVSLLSILAYTAGGLTTGVAILMG